MNFKYEISALKLWYYFVKRGLLWNKATNIKQNIVRGWIKKLEYNILEAERFQRTTIFFSYGATEKEREREESAVEHETVGAFSV